MTILITGGAGYLGSHACVEFVQAGHNCVVLDNLTNGYEESLRRVEQITGQAVPLVVGDVRNQDFVESILKKYTCDAVVHFAGLKSVGESTSLPLDYYDANVTGSINLLKAMQNCGVRKLIYSSSATVYGEPDYLPLDEHHPLKPVNAYGRTKMYVEELLRDLSASDPEWAIAILRYFNPVGAHKSGLIGENPGDHPANLMPIISQVASGQRSTLTIYGDDYDTEDGSGVRDYIHVTDLILGHVKAMEALDKFGGGEVLTTNLGTGRGYSVYELIAAFEHVSNLKIGHEVAGRRNGDVATCFADVSYARRKLDWQVQKSLSEMCSDTWNWISKNPRGYE